VYGRVFQTGRYDLGQKIDFLRANIELALDREDLGPELEAILLDIVRRRGLT
jgi:UTP--glucose-1-phosphate uridylyltransferase